MPTNLRYPAKSATAAAGHAGNGGMDLKLVRSAVFDALRKLKASPTQLLDEAARSAEPAIRRAIQEAVADAPSSERVA